MEEVNREVNKAEKHDQKAGPVPLVQVCEHQRTLCFVDVVASHARRDTIFPLVSCSQTLSGESLVTRFSSKPHRVYRVQSSHYVICEPRNLKPRNLILRASSSFSRKFPPTKITCYTVFVIAHKPCQGLSLSAVTRYMGVTRQQINQT